MRIIVDPFFYAALAICEYFKRTVSGPATPVSPRLITYSKIVNMKKAILLLLLFTSVEAYCQTVRLRLHLIRNEIGEMGLSIAQAEDLIVRIGEDYDGTTAFNELGGIIGDYDTGIRFCPEIIIHEDDNLIHQEHLDLHATLGDQQYIDVYYNFYGDHVSSGMIAGRTVGSGMNKGAWVTNYRIDNHTTTHEVGHTLGLPHCVAVVGSNVINPGCFDQFMSNTFAGAPGPPFLFTPTEILTLQGNVQANPQIVTSVCEEFPTADFEVDNKGPIATQNIQFTNLSSTNTTIWFWEFGDGNTSNVPNPIHQYATPGFYEVKLTVTSANNHSNTMTRSNYIHVDPPVTSIPFSEDFNDPDFYTGTTWFVEDAERNCMTMMSGDNTYMWHHASAVGDFYIAGSESIDFIDPSGLPSGALALRVADGRSSYDTEVKVNSPDFDFSTTTNCTSLSFSLCHIPFNNGYNTIPAPNGDNCICAGDYLNETEYEDYTLTTIDNWAPVCITNNPPCPGVSYGQANCNLEESLELQYTTTPGNANSWVTLYSKTREELLTVPGETCTPHPFAPIEAFWWRRECIDISTLTGLPRVRFRFRYNSGEGTNTLLIDDWEIQASLDLQTTALPVCLQGMGTAMVESCSGQAPYTYQWAEDCPAATPIPGNVNTITVTTPGDYSVTVTDANGCSAETCVYVGPCIPSSPTICPQECVTIGCIGEYGYTYSWSHEESRDTIVDGVQYTYTVTVTDGQTPQLCVSPLTTTTYNLELEHLPSGCVNIWPVVVTVDQSSNCTPAAVNNNCCAPNPPDPGNPCHQFYYNYGTGEEEYVGSSNPLHSGTVLQTSDRGYLMVGYSKSTTVGAFTDQQIVKVDEKGSLEWVKSVGDMNGFSDLNDVIETSDGAYVFTGGLGLVGATFTMHVMKTHANGNIIWDRVLYGDYFSTSRDIVEAANGDLLIGGYTNYGAESFYIVRMGANGNIIWRNNYRSTQNSYFNKLIELSNGNIAMVGGTLAGGIDAYVLVVNSLGNKVWSANYDLGGAEEFFDIAEQGTDLYVVGYTTGQTGNEDALTAAINSSTGVVQWTRTYRIGNTFQDDHFSAIVETSDNEFVAVGQLGSFSTQAVVAKFDNSGAETWTNIYGATFFYNLKGRDVIETVTDQGLAIFGTNFDEFMLIKTDGLGDIDTGCMPYTVVQNQSLNTTPLTPDFLTSHTDRLASPIPDFVKYHNQAIMTPANPYTVIGCFESCSSVQNNAKGNGNSRSAKVEEEPKVPIVETLAKVNIFPNPNNGQFNIAWENGTPAYHKLEIVNTLGKLVYAQSLVGLQQAQIDLSDYSKGVYLLRFHTGQEVQTQRIVIQ